MLGVFEFGGAREAVECGAQFEGRGAAECRVGRCSWCLWCCVGADTIAGAKMLSVVRQTSHVQRVRWSSSSSWFPSSSKSSSSSCCSPSSAVSQHPLRSSSSPSSHSTGLHPPLTAAHTPSLPATTTPPHDHPVTGGQISVVSRIFHVRNSVSVTRVSQVACETRPASRSGAASKAVFVGAGWRGDFRKRFKPQIRADSVGL